MRHATAAAHQPKPTTRADRPRPTRTALRLVPPVRTAAPRAPFVILVASLLVTGLAGLLFLHTALAEDSFTLHDLQVRSAVLQDQEQALEQSIARSAAPRVLADRARALGMVRSENPAFIRLSDGRILGKPKAGEAPPPPTPTPTASATPKLDPRATKHSTDKKRTKKKQRHRAHPSPSGGR